MSKIKALKLISKSLLVVIILFSASVFITTVIPSLSPGLNHNDCFGADCGPVQHLLHTYTSVHEVTLKNTVVIQTINTLSKDSPAYSIYAPDTPPPKISLV